jgi:methylated-DNA-[protein]-cysteine S-methyltransferase
MQHQPCRAALGDRGKLLRSKTVPRSQRLSPALRKTARLLERYLSGQPVDFNLPLDLSGLSAFTIAVLEACRRIPRGQTRSYSWVASQIGKPRAARAVGQALARNPLPIIVPCHRVVRADATLSAKVPGGLRITSGSLGGFSAGLRLKKALLRIERAANATELTFPIVAS